MSFISCLWKKLKLFISNHGTNGALLPTPSSGPSQCRWQSPDGSLGTTHFVFIWAGICLAPPCPSADGHLGDCGRNVTALLLTGSAFFLPTA